MDKRQLQRFSERVHWLPPDEETDRPILGIISGQNGSLVIEGGNSVAHAQLLLDQIGHLPPVRYLCLTHWHWDHVFGATAFNVPTFAHAKTKRIVAQMATWDWRDAALDQRVADGIEIEFCRDMIKRELPDRRNLVIRPPDVTFDTEVAIDLGDLTCRLIHVGGDHASDASIVYIPAEKVIFLSDCLYPAIYAETRHYTEKINDLYDQILSLEATHYFWGHNPDIMTRPEMELEAEQAAVISSVVRETADAPPVLYKRLQQTHPHFIFDEYTLELIAAFQAGLDV